MDWSWTSYLLGALSTAVLAILSVFFSEAARDLYIVVKRKIWPPDPDPVQVGQNFQPTNYVPESAVWAKESFVTDKLEAGYSFYRDPADGAPRYRISNPSSPQPVKEFFMMKPGADNPDATD